MSLLSYLPLGHDVWRCLTPYLTVAEYLRLRMVGKQWWSNSTLEYPQWRPSLRTTLTSVPRFLGFREVRLVNQHLSEVQWCLVKERLKEAVLAGVLDDIIIDGCNITPELAGSLLCCLAPRVRHVCVSRVSRVSRVCVRLDPPSPLCTLDLKGNSLAVNAETLQKVWSIPSLTRLNLEHNFCVLPLGSRRLPKSRLLHLGLLGTSVHWSDLENMLDTMVCPVHSLSLTAAQGVGSSRYADVLLRRERSWWSQLRSFRVKGLQNGVSQAVWRSVLVPDQPLEELDLDESLDCFPCELVGRHLVRVALDNMVVTSPQEAKDVSRWLLSLPRLQRLSTKSWKGRSFHYLVEALQNEEQTLGIVRWDLDCRAFYMCKTIVPEYLCRCKNLLSIYLCPAPFVLRRFLQESPAAQRVRHIDLSHSGFSIEDLTLFNRVMASGGLSQLEALDLHGNPGLTDRGMQSLVRSLRHRGARSRRLRHLSFYDTLVSSSVSWQALTVLTEAGFRFLTVEALSHLDLYDAGSVDSTLALACRRYKGSLWGPAVLRLPPVAFQELTDETLCLLSFCGCAVTALDGRQTPFSDLWELQGCED